MSRCGGWLGLSVRWVWWRGGLGGRVVRQAAAVLYEQTCCLLGVVGRAAWFLGGSLICDIAQLSSGDTRVMGERAIVLSP